MNRVFRLFDFSLQMQGFPMKVAKKQYAQIRNLSSEKFADYLLTQRQAIVAHHVQHNPLYQQLVSQKNSADWLSLPIMTKKHFQQPLAQRLSEGYTLKNVYVNKTSGSSGDPFIFAKDKFSHALTWANIITHFGQFGIDFNTSYQARFYGIPLDTMGYTKERLKDFLSGRFRFPIFDLSDKVLEEVLATFRRKKFDNINGYTSSIVLFAKFLQQKNIVLKDVCPTLKCCVVTSEMLFPEDKILLENQFGIPIINEYGASELDLIAFQNPKGEWQVNAETLFVEILDAQGNPVPNGQEGRIVITSLYNKAHPFIRYDIGDLGILDEKSTLQKPILHKLIGRTNDIAVLPSGKKSPGLTFYYVTKSIIEDDGNVQEFVIKQTKIDTFEIEYVSRIALTLPQIKAIEQAIETYLESGLTFHFSRKETLVRSKSGKLKQFVSLI